MDLKIKSSKNLKLSASFTKTEQNAMGLAILMPGFLDSKDYSHLTHLAQNLTQLGFDAVSFNPVGTWDSQGNLSDYSVSQYLTDLAAVITHFQNNNYQQIVLIGHSLGGMIAMLYGTEHNQIINAVVALMPPSSQTRPDKFQPVLKKWKDKGYKISTRNLPGRLNQEKQYKVPYEYILAAKNYDVLTVISKLNAPLLLVAAQDDDGIRPAEIKEIYDQANEPKQFTILENTDHDYRRDQRQIKKVNLEIEKFLEKWILTQD